MIQSQGRLRRSEEEEKSQLLSVPWAGRKLVDQVSRHEHAKMQLIVGYCVVFHSSLR